MTTDDFAQTFNMENELASVVIGSNTTSFSYDANGQRVKTVESGKTTYFPFPNYEETVQGTTVIKRSSYIIAGQVVAFRVAGDVTANNGLFYVFTDHLGSTSFLRKSDETVLLAGSTTRYLPYGGYRGAPPTQTTTDRDFTGQKENRELGLVYYNARFYVPGVGRFASADTIVPDPTNPQSLNRYAYTLNNPTIYVDPSGHCWGFASGLRNTFYATTCNNLDMALSIVQHPDATTRQKIGAGAYIVAEAAVHTVAIAGTAVASVG